MLVKTPLGRGFDEPRLALVGQYDEVRLDGLEPERNRERRRTVGLNYHPAGQWLLKLAYEWNDTSGPGLAKGDADGWTGSVAFVFYL